jgi:hypothetical protein
VSAPREFACGLGPGLKAHNALALVRWSSRFRQPCFFSQLRINIRQIFPKPLVTLAAQQGVLPVVLPPSLCVAFLLRSESFFHLRFLSFLRDPPGLKGFYTAEQCSVRRC